jgi:chemotaxis signal transduction protein
MLWLVFQVNRRPWGIRAQDVREVVPFVALHPPTPGGPNWLRGFADYRGARIPVADVAALAGAPPARDLLSTRIFVAHGTERPDRLLGLLAEHATDTRRPGPACEPVPRDADLPDWVECWICEAGSVLPLLQVDRLPAWKELP